MGRKNGSDGPWAIFPATDQTPLSTTATLTLSTSTTTSSATSQTSVSTAVTLVGASGVDSLTGSSVTTALVQGSTTLVNISSSSLIGSSGSDTLMGSQGGTTLVGNGGADLFVVQNKAGIDQVMDFTDGQDKLMLTNSLTFGKLNLTQQGQDTLISSNNTPLMLLHNISSNLITAADIA